MAFKKRAFLSLVALNISKTGRFILKCSLQAGVLIKRFLIFRICAVVAHLYYSFY